MGTTFYSLVGGRVRARRVATRIDPVWAPPSDARAALDPGRSVPANVTETRWGRLRPVCLFCGGPGRALNRDGGRLVGLLDLDPGWGLALYPPSHVHPDGSHGALFHCGDCGVRLAAGESLRTRAYLPHVVGEIAREVPQ
ncbi:MAG: hypothetical protein ACRCSN_15745 [Dermatophilaceae bacterium]